MQVTITKRGRRNELRCLREDGSCELADLGPGLPHHDLAHWVAEGEWNLRAGFFGNIARGYSLVQLSDKNVIRTLGPESLQAEILARAVGSVQTGACTEEQFGELVNSELEHWHVATLPMSEARTRAAILRFRELLARFDALPEGESLQLEFESAP